jgi:hypothetical protein
MLMLALPQAHSIAQRLPSVTVVQSESVEHA